MLIAWLIRRNGRPYQNVGKSSESTLEIEDEEQKLPVVEDGSAPVIESLGKGARGASTAK